MQAPQNQLLLLRYNNYKVPVRDRFRSRDDVALFKPNLSILRRIHTMPIYANWQGHLALPFGLATHNSLGPYWKWHTDEDLLVAAAAVILIYQESHKPRN